MEKLVDKKMTFDDFSGDENAPSVEIPRELRNLRTQAYDKSVSDLVSMIASGDIMLDPDYQRNYIWDNTRASLLIESILLNVPIPVIYLAEDDESKWVVVDGLQRLNTLRRFFSNEFKLTKLEVLSELNRFQYSTLNPKAQRILKNGIIRIILILKESHPEIKYDIFHRLNSGAIRLNEQELRNCLYRGKFNMLLKELRKNTTFLEFLGLKYPHKRFHDSELILRYFAITDAFDFETRKLAGYQNKMKTFLNDYMDSQKAITEVEEDKYRDRFNETIKKVDYVFGKQAFRRIDSDGSRDPRVNRALMDVIMLGFELADFEQLKSKKENILEIYRDLPINDSLFHNAIMYGTSDTKKIEYRISAWLDRMVAIGIPLD